MSVSGFVADRVAAALRETPSADAESRAVVADRATQVLRPGGALRRLDELAIWLAGWTLPVSAADLTATTLIFAADHGVAAHGVSAYPAEVTAAMKAAIENQVATSTALANVNGSTLSLIDVGVGRPTADFTEADAVDAARFVEAWTAGEQAVARADSDVLILGELGIGNTTAAAAVAAGIIGGVGAEWVGRGTGVDDEGIARKVAVVDAGLDRIGRRRSDPTQVLAALGGVELVAIAGAATEARRLSRPILLDGFIATAALLPLHALDSGFLDHTVAAHCSGEQSHRRMLEWLAREPLLDLELRLGEGTGALIALPILRAALAGVLDVATFAEAGVPGPGG